MGYETKIKVEKFIFYFLTFAGYTGIGAFMGAYLIVLEKHLNRDLAFKEVFWYMWLFFVVLYIGFFVNLFLHEVGHMIFGLLTGYQFISLRFGKLMITKVDGKLKLCRFNLPGTGGQCIMLAPQREIDEMPVVLFNLGGLIMNLMSILIGLVVFFGYKSTHILISMYGMTFALISLMMFITNGLPFEQLGTDGANAIILHKNKLARKIFCNQLEIIHYISNNYSISEVPEELVAFDENAVMDNPLVTSQAIQYYNYLTGTKRYEEAKRVAWRILDNAKSINDLHRKILYGEVVFIAAVWDKDVERAKELYNKYQKEIKSIAGLISTQRVMYAYYTLVEPDQKKANQFAKKFANSVKHYPYPKDAQGEQEEFDRVLQR